MSTYQIRRFYRDDRPTETIETGLTLEQAQAHCQRSDTRGEDWFDGYQEEDQFDPDVLDHPHYKGMVLAVQQLEGYMRQGFSVADVMVAADIDPESLFAMAKQRGLRLFETMPDANTRDEVIGQLAAIWIDAFLVGLKVGDGRTMIDVEQVLDVDGNRRQGGN